MRFGAVWRIMSPCVRDVDDVGLHLGSTIAACEHSACLTLHLDTQTEERIANGGWARDQQTSRTATEIRNSEQIVVERDMKRYSEFSKSALEAILPGYQSPNFGAVGQRDKSDYSDMRVQFQLVKSHDFSQPRFAGVA